MGHRDDEDFGIKNLVDHAIGKAARLASAGVVRVRRPRGWILPDEVECVENLQEKSLP
jgi:hypothetical protein